MSSGLAEAAYAEFGRVDILVNNAGMSPAIPSHDVTEAWFDKIVVAELQGAVQAGLSGRQADG